jgi:pyridoxine 5-phosphate synthase
MTRLSVNVNKLATLRNSRGKNLPDVIAWSKRILDYGAFGITVHPRPYGRHIRLADVESLRGLLHSWNQRERARAEFNIEGYPEDEFLALNERVQADQCTLVPDPPEALTSNAGWDLVRHEPFLSGVLQRLKGAGIRSSLFVDPAAMNAAQLAALSRLKPDRIELYTEAFSDAYGTASLERVARGYRELAEQARDLGIGVNAGHDLNQNNLGYLIAEIPWIDEVSIGHALICEALEQGMQRTIAAYLKILERK